MDNVLSSSLEEVLAQATKAAEAAEVFFLSSEETPVSFDANRLKLLQSRQSQGLALRLVKDGRVGFASTTNLDHRDRLVAMALETAQFGAEARFDFPGLAPLTPVEVYDGTVESVSVEEMIHLGQSLIDAARAVEPELLCDAGVSRSQMTLRLLNSAGGQVEYTKSAFSLGLQATLIRGTDMLFVGDWDSSCHPISSGQSVIAETLRQLELARTIAPAPQGEVPVIFTPRGVAGALLMPLGVAFSGRTVLQGASYLGDKLGQRVFDPRLSLWDDPTIAFRPGSRPCDDEGLPSSRLALIEGGVVARFLYDLQTAGQAGVKSTASAHRGLGSLPGPGITTLVVSEGEANFEDMVKDMKRGLVVEGLMGAGQGNVLEGDFSGNVILGYAVENGEIVGRVKDTMVAGNVYRALAELVAVGQPGRWVGGRLYTPAIYCAKLSVASKS